MYSHLSGKVIPLENVEDEVFSQKILGEGIAVEPNDGKLYAPCDGVIDNIFDTMHAVNITSEGGAEILLHIGIDTVRLGGKYFISHIEQGQRVKKGDLLISFDMDKIKAEGYKLTTPMIICNSEDYSAFETLRQGEIQRGSEILKIR